MENLTQLDFEETYGKSLSFNCGCL